MLAGGTVRRMGDRSAETSAVRDRLDALVLALTHHLDAVQRRAGETDPEVFAAFDHLADAFAGYEDALYDVYDEVVPMTLVTYDDEDDEDVADVGG